MTWRHVFLCFLRGLTHSNWRVCILLTRYYGIVIVNSYTQLCGGKVIRLLIIGHYGIGILSSFMRLYDAGWFIFCWYDSITLSFNVFLHTDDDWKRVILQCSYPSWSQVANLSCGQNFVMHFIMISLRPWPCQLYSKNEFVCVVWIGINMAGTHKYIIVTFYLCQSNPWRPSH